MLAQTSRPWHSLRCFGPFAVFDLHGKEDVPEGSASMLNRAEAQFVLCLYKDMQAAVAELRDGTASVAVISPYKAQVGGEPQASMCFKHAPKAVAASL